MGINNFFENIGELEIKDNKSEEIYYNGVDLGDMNDILEKKIKKDNLLRVKMSTDKESNDFFRNINVENYLRFKNIVNKYKFFILNNDEIEYYLVHKSVLLINPDSYIHNMIEELINENND